ncbi:MAG TPA: CopD family protein [Ktedonosporobacter sp.]|nr:CopD family protein [Ktedonosporobacter sp.]
MLHRRRSPVEGRRSRYVIYAGAWVLAVCWMVLFSSTASAHAILLRASPSKDAVLKSAPVQIQMWFSEHLSPSLTTAYVVNAATATPQSMTDKGTHVDLGDVHISLRDAKELDLSLKPSLSPAIYLVFYRTQSADDGHILSGSFLFTVAEPNGLVPSFHGSLPAASAEAFSTNGQLDGPTFFSFLMLTLVELGVVFWMGAQLWLFLVLEPARRVAPLEGARGGGFLSASQTGPLKGGDPTRAALDQEVAQRFERLFALPTLVVLLLANAGVLIGQALVGTGGQWSQALAPVFLYNLLAGGNSEIYWAMREIVIALLLVLAIWPIVFKQRLRVFRAVLPWANLGLGAALLSTMALTGHAAAAGNKVVITSLLIDWLHLLAAALWVGGMFYLATIYLPVLRGRALKEQVSALLTTLPRYSPLAITGVILMTVSGPLNAVVDTLTWGQLLTTVYGRILIVKVLLVAGLLLTSAVHVFWFRPLLKKTYQQYIGLLEAAQKQAATPSSPPQVTTQPPPGAQQVKALEGRVRQQTIRLTRTLRWEPLLGVAVLICTGFLNVFAGTLQPAGPSLQQSLAPAKPMVSTVKTTDGLFTATLTVSPNRQGPNTFTVRVLNGQSQLQTGVGVSIYTTLVGMDMGTEALNLQPDGKGNFSASGDFSMSGSWQLRIEIRTADNSLHEAHVQVRTS